MRMRTKVASFKCILFSIAMAGMVSVSGCGALEGLTDGGDLKEISDMGGNDADDPYAGRRGGSLPPMFYERGCGFDAPCGQPLPGQKPDNVGQPKE